MKCTLPHLHKMIYQETNQDTSTCHQGDFTLPILCLKPISLYQNITIANSFSCSAVSSKSHNNSQHDVSTSPVGDKSWQTSKHEKRDASKIIPKHTQLNPLGLKPRIHPCDHSACHCCPPQEHHHTCTVQVLSFHSSTICLFHCCLFLIKDNSIL